jgi:antitoxin CptB
MCHGDPRDDTGRTEAYTTVLAKAASEPRLGYEFLMPYAQEPECGLDARRRRIRFRAWHRGMLEMDLIMGRFVDAEIEALDAAGIAELERLLEAEDHDVLGWVTGEIAIPHDYDTAVLRRIRARHACAGGLDRF